MPPILNQDDERRRFNLIRLSTGHVRKSLWLHPHHVRYMNDSEILMNRGFRWVEDGQIDAFSLLPIDHNSFFTCTPQNMCRK